jgi:hypothetical protein
VSVQWKLFVVVFVIVLLRNAAFVHGVVCACCDGATAQGAAAHQLQSMLPCTSLRK